MACLAYQGHMARIEWLVERNHALEITEDVLGNGCPEADNLLSYDVYIWCNSNLRNHRR
jgi:hypothetical protein